MVDRKNINDFIFLDLDKLVSMSIEKFQYPTQDRVLRDGFRVDGITDQGMKVKELFIDLDSGKPDTCKDWIAKNWLNQTVFEKVVGKKK